MPNKLIEMSSRLYNVPHLIDQPAFKWVEGIVSAQELPFIKKETAIKVDGDKKKRELQYNPDTKVGMISVHGPLTYVEYEALCGEANASYQQIQSEFEQLVDAGAKTILFDVDSPGGEAYGMLETGRYMRDVADINDVKLIAYVDGLAASAGYGLAASAHEIILNPEAEAGSIGVVVKLRNVNGAMKEMGVKDSYIFAGKGKIPYDADGEFTQEFLEDIQEKVNALYERFTSYVAEMQGIPVEAVKATGAKVFMAEKAVALGLAHKIMTRESFFEYLADTVETGDKMLGKLFNTEKDKPKMVKPVDVADATLLQTQLTELSAEFETVKTALATAEAALAEKTAEAVAMAAALAEATSKLAAYTAAEEKAKADAEAARVAARKASLVDAVGEAEAEALYASLEALPDAAFEAVVGKMKAASLATETNPMFQEQGVGGEGEGAPVDSAHLNALIANKYGRKA